MFNSIYQIAKNTFRESVREPIFLLLTATALCMIGSFPLFTMFIFTGYEKLVTDSSMATIMVFGWIIAVLISSHTISREIANGTALLMLSKPVQRPVFIVAKVLGILAANTVFCFLTGVAALICLRISVDQFNFDVKLQSMYYGAIILSFAIGGIYNYVTRQTFTSATLISLVVLLPLTALFGHFMKVQDEHIGLAFRIIPAIVLVMFSVWAMGTLATALSTRFSLVPNMLLCAAIFCVGLMSDYLIGRGAKEKWEVIPPKGSQTLWVAFYTFSPQEMADIEQWEPPVKLEALADFVVWTSSKHRESVGELPPLGEEPASAWKDGHDWVSNPEELKAPPIGFALYNAADTKTPWTYCEVSAPEFIRGKMSAEEKTDYTAYVFRRSYAPPRIPKGGTYAHPLPDSGNYVASALYAAVPNWQLFWMADALSSRAGDPSVNPQNPTSPSAYVVYASLYTLALNALLVLLAILLFSNREVGKQMIV